jgi:hypothetical protein
MDKDIYKQKVINDLILRLLENEKKPDDCLNKVFVLDVDVNFDKFNEIENIIIEYSFTKDYIFYTTNRWEDTKSLKIEQKQPSEVNNTVSENKN